jgi:hypothetical protein
MFLTYSLLTGHSRSRRWIDQLLQWADGRNFEGVLVLDEVSLQSVKLTSRRITFGGDAALDVRNSHQDYVSASLIAISFKR